MPRLQDVTMSLLELLMPPACAGCGRNGALLCDACRDGLRRPARPEDRFVAADAGIVIGDALALAVAAFVYEGPMRRSLAALKYGGASRLAPHLASASAPALRELLAITGPATLVPVPIHPERRRSRGYNQAELIACELAHQLDQPMVPILERSRATTKQHRLNRVARLRNLRDAFTVARSPPQTVIVVDDIITTAATLEACASVLLAAGSKTVYGFAVAREV
jgi:ComF family protein